MIKMIERLLTSHWLLPESTTVSSTKSTTHRPVSKTSCIQIFHQITMRYHDCQQPIYRLFSYQKNIYRWCSHEMSHVPYVFSMNSLFLCGWLALHWWFTIDFPLSITCCIYRWCFHYIRYIYTYKYIHIYIQIYRYELISLCYCDHYHL